MKVELVFIVLFGQTNVFAYLNHQIVNQLCFDVKIQFIAWSNRRLTPQLGLKHLPILWLSILNYPLVFNLPLKTCHIA